jgi:hypothetical protein
MIKNQQPMREGVECLLLESEKLAVGAVRADQSTITVRLVWRLQAKSRHSLKEEL